MDSRVHKCVATRRRSFPHHKQDMKRPDTKSRQKASDGKRFLNYILWFPHDTEFLITIGHMIFQAYTSETVDFFRYDVVCVLY